MAGSLQAFPNPAVDHVSFTLGPDVHTSLEIFDVTGRLVRTFSLADRSGSTEQDSDGTRSQRESASLEWNLRDTNGSLVPVGMYWARATTDGGTLSTRFVILSR